MNLGKKIVPPAPEAGPDEWKPFKGQHGTNMERNARTGEIRTDQTPSGPQYPDPYQHLLDILRKQEGEWHSTGWITRHLRQQEEDGFPLNEFGVL